MILTIKAPNKAGLQRGVWQAQMMMGLETEVNVDNTFEIVCHDPNKVQKILQESNGTIISQR